MIVRDAAAAEADALAAFLNEQSQAVFGTTDLSPEAVAGWFQIPDLDVLVVEEERRLVAYADMQNHGDDETVWIDPRALPSHPAAVESLFAELERRAADRGRRVVRAVVADTEDETRQILEGRGYRPIRHSYRMLIELHGESPPPVWPAGIDVRTAEPGEEEAVYAAYADAFADHWGFVAEPFDHWRRHHADSPLARKDLWILALDGDDIAGVCVCSTHESGERGYGWVNILGVRRPWRRRGLGEGLLRHAFAAFAAEGATRVGLGVDGESTTGAVRLYERAGMRVVRRYDTYELRLDG